MKKALFSIFSFLFLVSSTQAAFTDQSEIQSWAEKAIHTLTYLEVISGNEDGSFQPNKTINRAEFSKIMVLATKAPLTYPQESSFSDVQTSDWFFPYVETAKTKGWIDGYEDGSFKPGNTINRAEVAKIIAEGFNLDISSQVGPWYSKYFVSLAEQNLLPYNTPENNIGPEVLPSRAEIVEMVYRAMLQYGLFEPENVPEMPQEAINYSNFSTEASNSNYIQGSETSFVSEDERGAGTINVTKINLPQQNRDVSPDQTNITAISLNLSAEEDPVVISGMQFRRIGKGSIQDFKGMTLEANGQEVAEISNPTDDILTLPFSDPVTINKNNTITFTLKVNMETFLGSETSSRFVLYLPEWIEANTTTKTGFFPFGGINLNTQ